MPARFGSRLEMTAGIMRALADSGSPAPVQAVQVARGMPNAAREFKGHVTAFCEVAQMLTDQLGLPATMQGLFAYLVERWDGRGLPGRARHEAIPLPLRIASVARDAAFQCMLGGAEFAARVVRRRAGGAFDPALATPFADAAAELLAFDADASAWEETLAPRGGRTVRHAARAHGLGRSPHRTSPRPLVSVGHHLARQGRPFLILDANQRVGDAC